MGLSLPRAEGEKGPEPSVHLREGRERQCVGSSVRGHCDAQAAPSRGHPALCSGPHRWPRWPFSSSHPGESWEEPSPWPQPPSAETPVPSPRCPAQGPTAQALVPEQVCNTAHKLPRPQGKGTACLKVPAGGWSPPSRPWGSEGLGQAPGSSAVGGRGCVAAQALPSTARPPAPSTR